MTPQEAAARELLDIDVSVIQVNKTNKKPSIEWKEFQNRAAEEEELRRWWENNSDGNVAIVTGRISNILVIDCDNEEAFHKFQERYLPELLEPPTVKTPRGYHIYFQMPDVEIRNTVELMPGTDVRGEGGYAIAPPSANGTGTGYSWLPGLSIFDVKPPPVPKDLYNFLFMHIGGNKKQATKTTEATKATEYFAQGRRDNDLFSTANALTKAGCDTEFTLKTLEILAENCKPPFPVEEVRIKIDSAVKRAERRDGNIAAEVKEWVEATNGHFETTSCHKELDLTTKTTKKAANMALARLCEGQDAILERYGSRRGCYRLIDRSIEYMDFLGADISNTVDLRLPLDIHVKTNIYPKAAIALAGVSGMGKTILALKTIALNRGKFPIFYFNSEMSAPALKKKLSHFPMPIEEWAKAMKVVDGWDFYNIADKIQPDALNVIDYLEPEGDKPYNIHGVISAIISRLDKGTALICIQKKPGTTLGTGGIYSIKAATLALSLDWGKIEIVKNRFREADPMPNANKIEFEIHKGFEFVSSDGWHK